MPTNLIVYLPGYTGLPAAKYNPLLKRLRDNGYDTISINYKNFGRGSISETADRVIRVIKPLRDSYDHITLMGHSMGGLVATKVLKKNSTVADSLVTLGSPHRGIQGPLRGILPYFLGGISAQQMLKGSKTLKYTQLPEVPTLNIAGSWDLIVKDSFMPSDEDVTQITIPKITHLGLILSNRVYGEIAAWLTYDILDSLGFEGKGKDLNS